MHGDGLEILSRKQMLQRLLIVLAQVKSGNAFENVLNEIRQILYYFYWEKEDTKMDTIFMNSRNSKTSDPHRLLLNLADKTNLKRSDNYQ